MVSGHSARKQPVAAMHVDRVAETSILSTSAFKMRDLIEQSALDK